jgi:hypothetical protein
LGDLTKTFSGYPEGIAKEWIEQKEHRSVGIISLPNVPSDKLDLREAQAVRGSVGGHGSIRYDFYSTAASTGNQSRVEDSPAIPGTQIIEYIVSMG